MEGLDKATSTISKQLWGESRTNILKLMEWLGKATSTISKHNLERKSDKHSKINKNDVL
jgi:hypothetical protein